jgi:hypothetical protein
MPTTSSAANGSLHSDSSSYAQTLAKIEGGHTQDLEDVHALVERGLVDPTRALAYLDEVEEELYRYPAVDAASFRRRVEEAF